MSNPVRRVLVFLRRTDRRLALLPLFAQWFNVLQRPSATLFDLTKVCIVLANFVRCVFAFFFFLFSWSLSVTSRYLRSKRSGIAVL